MAPDSLHDRLVCTVLADPICSAILERGPSLGLTEWWLTGGAVFQNVWNEIEGRPPGHGIRDYDIFYFDDGALSWEAEDTVIKAAQTLFADLPVMVEVRNEARVHLWYEDKFGVPAKPFTSATDAIDSFASTTCCVGMTNDSRGLSIHAPHGLEDIFGLHLRPNPRLAPRAVYESKVRDYRARWPSITSDAWPT
nr:nucleotidyltransferase family protein [Ornithinimicrobium sp. HY1745]